MIGYFPKMYEDELVYSYLARIGVHNGYLQYSQLSQDLYGKTLYIPSFDFINKLLPEVESHLVGSGTMEDIILNHTMYSFYTGFVQEEQKKCAMKKIVDGNGEYYKEMPIPKKQRVRYMRTCPLCVQEDRERYGETYWHLSHQLQGIDVCHKHGCYLTDSQFQISANKSMKLITAEEIEVENAVMGTQREVELARYVIEVMRNINTYPDKDIISLLNWALIEAEYVSKRGDVRYINTLCIDFIKYYSDIKDMQSVEIYRTRISNILKGKRQDFIEICQLAMFLNVPADHLWKCDVERFDKMQYTQAFDKKVLKMIDSGISLNEISRQLSVSSKTTRDIRDNAYKKKKHTFNGKGGKKRIDWETIDKELLPKVISAMVQVIKENEERPIRLTKSAVCHLLDFPYIWYRTCPLCNEAVEEKMESYGEYWARELVWAVKKLEKEGKEIHITNICKLTNMRKQNVIDGMECITDKIYKDIIKSCLV